MHDTSVRSLTHGQEEASPTESHMHWTGPSLNSRECDTGGYYKVAHGKKLGPIETPCPCRALVDV